MNVNSTFSFTEIILSGLSAADAVGIRMFHQVMSTSRRVFNSKGLDERCTATSILQYLVALRSFIRLARKDHHFIVKSPFNNYKCR